MLKGWRRRRHIVTRRNVILPFQRQRSVVVRSVVAVTVDVIVDTDVVVVVIVLDVLFFLHRFFVSVDILNDVFVVE